MGNRMVVLSPWHSTWDCPWSTHGFNVAFRKVLAITIDDNGTSVQPIKGICCLDSFHSGLTHIYHLDNNAIMCHTHTHTRRQVTRSCGTMQVLFPSPICLSVRFLKGLHPMSSGTAASARPPKLCSDVVNPCFAYTTPDIRQALKLNRKCKLLHLRLPGTQNMCLSWGWGRRHNAVFCLATFCYCNLSLSLSRVHEKGVNYMNVN